MPAISSSSSAAFAVRRTVDIDAPAELVWRLVSDLPGMGRFSPENAGGRWLRGATGPAPGARFRGANRNGRRRWSTVVAVVEAEPGHRFAFDVSSLGLAIARWSYDVTERAGGCLLTETWEDRRGRVMQGLGRLVSGVDDRAAHTARSIEATLAAVKTTAEDLARRDP